MQQQLLDLNAVARCMDFIREKSCGGREELLVMLMANLTSLEAGAEALLQVRWWRLPAGGGRLCGGAGGGRQGRLRAAECAALAVRVCPPCEACLATAQQEHGTGHASRASLIMPLLLPACVLQVGRGALEGLNVAMLLKLFLLPVGSGAPGVCVGLAALGSLPGFELRRSAVPCGSALAVQKLRAACQHSPA